MATVYKILGSAVVVADTSTGLYTVPASNSALVSSIVVCNTGTSERTFRIAMVPGAISAIQIQHYIFYDVPIPANDSFIATCGYTLATGNSILVRASHADVVFSAYGTEIST